jgi:hypothetical protein
LDRVAGGQKLSTEQVLTGISPRQARGLPNKVDRL